MFGFGKGKIEIQLDNFNYKPGDTIEGTVALKLKKSIQATALAIALTGEQKVTSGIGDKRSSRTEKIFDFKHPLDGEKEYAAGSEPLVYPFKIKIPKDVLDQKKAPEGTLGQVLKVAQFMAGSKRRIDWHLTAELDVPRAIDMRKRIQVNIN
jgi:hypothetical protein